MHVQLLLIVSSFINAQTLAQSAPPDSTQKCAAETAKLATSPCFSTLQTDIRKLVSSNTQNGSDMYTLAQTLITHTCAAEPCTDQAWLNTTSGLVDSCTPSVSKLWSETKHEPSTNRIVTDIEIVGKSSFAFIKDFVCVKDSAGPCTSAWLDMAKKSNLVSFTTLDQFAATTTNQSLRNNTVQFMRQFGMSVIPVVNEQAFKDIPSTDLCTPCTRVLVSQLSSFVYKTIVPLWTDLDQDDAQGLKAKVDGLVKGVNYKCNDNAFVKTNANVVLGSGIKSIDQVPNYTSASAARRVPGPAVYLSIAVFLVSYLLL